VDVLYHLSIDDAMTRRRKTEMTTMATKTQTKTTARAAAKPSTKRAKPAKKLSMMAHANELLLAGKNNAEVTAVLTKEHGLPEKHKHYAGWFRAALVRKLTGQLGEASSKKAKAALEKQINVLRTANVKLVTVAAESMGTGTATA
jgi:hypothetical protein